MVDSIPKVEYFGVQETSARMQASTENFYDRISSMKTVDYKMDQSPKPAIHSIDLRIK